MGVSKARSLYISAASCKTLLIFKCLLCKIWDKLQHEGPFKCLQLLLIPLSIEARTKALIQFHFFSESLCYFLSQKLTTLPHHTAEWVKEKTLSVYTSPTLRGSWASLARNFKWFPMSHDMFRGKKTLQTWRGYFLRTKKIYWGVGPSPPLFSVKRN